MGTQQQQERQMEREEERIMGDWGSQSYKKMQEDRLICPAISVWVVSHTTRLLLLTLVSPMSPIPEFK